MKKFNERLSYLMDEVLKTSGNALGTTLKVNVSSVLRYKDGKNLPTVEFAEKLCNHFGISANWLVLGIGPIKISDLVLNDEDERSPTVNGHKKKALVEDLDRLQSVISEIKAKYVI